MLPLQPLDQRQALLDRLQPARLGLDRVLVGAQLRGDVGEFEQGCGDSLAESIERGVDSRRVSEPAFSRGERPGGTRPVVVGPGDRPKRRRSRLAQPLGVAEALALGAKLRALIRVGSRGVDLVELEAHQVEVALAGALAVGKVGELALSIAHRAVRRPVGLAQLEMVRAREPVEDVELRRAESQAPVLVLAEERQEPGAQKLQVGDARRAALDVGARPPRRAHAAGDHELLCVLGQPLGEIGELRVVPEARRQLEYALDVGLPRARAHDLRARLAAHQEVERVREHGLARAGLARDRVQARPQAELGALDQEEVLDSELEQHPVQR